MILLLIAITLNVLIGLTATHFGRGQRMASLAVAAVLSTLYLSGVGLS